MATKYFKLERMVKETFERLCWSLNLNQSEIVNRLLAKWIEENQNQPRIDLYLTPEARIIINQPTQVNIEQKFELHMVKLDLTKALDLFTHNPEDPQFKEQVLKAAIKAGRLYRQTRDPELEALIKKVEETL